MGHLRGVRMGEQDIQEAIDQAASRAGQEFVAWLKANPGFTFEEMEEQMLLIQRRLVAEIVSGVRARRAAAVLREGNVLPGGAPTLTDPSAGGEAGLSGGGMS
ncbi:MAG: hypothetical protein HYY04_07510 [Chloroflexi bacterium]|nr:hypothetical protein [Chloroflexota bacterium]